MAATIPLLSVWSPPRLDAGLSYAVTIEGWEPEEEALVVAGIPLPEPLPRVTVTRRTEGRLPETMGSIVSIRLVSERIYGVLLRAMPASFQFVSSSISAIDAPYYIPNLLERRSCPLDAEGRLTVRDADLPPLFRVEGSPSIWIVRPDLERRLRSELAGDFVPLHQFRTDGRSRYRPLAEDRWP